MSVCRAPLRASKNKGGKKKKINRQGPSPLCSAFDYMQNVRPVGKGGLLSLRAPTGKKRREDFISLIL